MFRINTLLISFLILFTFILLSISLNGSSQNTSNLTLSSVEESAFFPSAVASSTCDGDICSNMNMVCTGWWWWQECVVPRVLGNESYVNCAENGTGCVTQTCGIF